MLDITGQGIEYSGLVALSKVLQLNSILERVVIDGNNIDLPSLRAIAHALERGNRALQSIPLPIHDISHMLSKLDENGRNEVGALWNSIEQSLRRNLRPKLGDSEQLRSRGADDGITLFRSDEVQQLRNKVRVVVAQSGASLTEAQQALLDEVDNHDRTLLALNAVRSRLGIHVFSCCFCCFVFVCLCFFDTVNSSDECGRCCDGHFAECTAGFVAPFQCSH